MPWTITPITAICCPPSSLTPIPRRSWPCAKAGSPSKSPAKAYAQPSPRCRPKPRPTSNCAGGPSSALPKRRRTPGKLPNSPKSKVLLWHSIRVTAQSRLWWVVLILLKTNSTTSRKLGGNRVPASNLSSTPHLWKKASLPPPSSMTHPCFLVRASPADNPGSPRTTTAHLKAQ